MTKVKNANTDIDEFDEFEEQEEKKAENAKVTFEIPSDMDPKSMEALMKKMNRITTEHLAHDKVISDGRKKYIEQSKVRYICEVYSNRPKWPDFEMYISNPKNDKPVPLRGLCGVRLKEGLTKYAIDRLEAAHEYYFVSGWNMTSSDIMQVDSAMVLTHKKVKRPLYSVRVFGEVENPIPVGQKIGRSKVLKDRD